MVTNNHPMPSNQSSRTVSPTICSYRSMARQKARGHQPAMQPSEGCRVERLDAQNVPEHQRVCGYSDKGGSKDLNG